MSSNDAGAGNTTASGKPGADKSSHSRLPSLNQLAARMNIANSGAPQVSSSSRPRLAASFLRTGSSVSVNTTASTNDSVAANAPSTRTASDASSRASSPALSTTTTSNNAGGVVNGGEPLTQEKLEKHDQMDVVEKRQHRVGYKNVPSLDVITARLAMTRSLSIDGTTQPPEPELYEDPKTPGIFQKPSEHPLQHQWTIFYDSKARLANAYTPSNPTGTFPAQAPSGPMAVDTGEYEAGLTAIGDFVTVESFCRYFNWLKAPSQLERNSNYHLFKTGIKPMWEDPANASGGKWVLTMKNNPQLLDRCWSWITMALVGEELDEGNEICGAVVSLRSKVDRIQLWIRSKDDVEKINGIGRRLVKLLDVSEADGIGLDFQYNSDDRPPPNKYLSIQATFPQSSFRSTFVPPGAKGQSSGEPPANIGVGAGAPPNAGVGGAFGAFSGSSAFAPGAGAFGGGGWRGGKRG